MRATLVPDGSFSAHENGDAVRAAETVFLSVPFRNQSETLTNLKKSLIPGQLLIDATVPLAAAVSGKATRMLGVWQGSAAQQALEMAPRGRACRLRAAHRQRGLPERPRAPAGTGCADLRRLARTTSAARPS